MRPSTAHSGASAVTFATTDAVYFLCFLSPPERCVILQPLTRLAYMQSGEECCCLCGGTWSAKPPPPPPRAYVARLSREPVSAEGAALHCQLSSLADHMKF